MGRRRSSRRPFVSACLGRMRSKSPSAALSRHRLIGRVENVALARINLARDAGNEHVAALKSQRAFERRDQVAVVVLVRERVALVGEVPRIASMLGGVLRRDDPAIIDQFAKGDGLDNHRLFRSEEHTSELQSLMRISYAVFCLKTKKPTQNDKKTKYHSNKHCN